ncbi:MAG: XRE family transcriptional regulator, partial [Pseudomonadota bacterium]|nr:XRE family transcriptional regulator [Pseudomonadota bacterium]
FLFGRLIGREGNKLHLLPPGAGGRQSVVSDPPWIAMAVRLVRTL